MDETAKIALERQNPWWFGKEFDTGIDRLPWYPLITKYLKAREVLLIVGARRTGKSTLVYQIVKRCDGTPNRSRAAGHDGAVAL